MTVYQKLSGVAFHIWFATPSLFTLWNGPRGPLDSRPVNRALGLFHGPHWGKGQGSGRMALIGQKQGPK